jgi:hypothetical protein
MQSTTVQEAPAKEGVRECAGCGVEFTSKPWNLDSYCSNRCRRRVQNEGPGND